MNSDRNDDEIEFLKKLIDLTHSKKVKRLVYHGIEIEPDLDPAKQERLADDAEKASIEAQSAVGKLFNVSEEQLLVNPYHGLDDVIQSVNNETTGKVAEQSMEGLTDE